jgi:hypothetical protein
MTVMEASSCAFSAQMRSRSDAVPVVLLTLYLRSV